MPILWCVTSTVKNLLTEYQLFKKEKTHKTTTKIVFETVGSDPNNVSCRYLKKQKN